MKNVLHVVASLKNGGTEKVVYNICKENHKYRQYHMILFVIGDIDKEVMEKFKLLDVEIFQSNVNFSHRKLLMKELQYLCHQLAIDVIHSHINLSNSFIMKVGKQANVKVRVSHAHSIILKESKNVTNSLKIFIQRLMIRKYSTHLVAPTKSTGITMFGKAFVKKGIVLPNFVEYLDNEKIALACAKAKTLQIKYGLKTKHIIGCVGRFDENKYQEYPIQLMPKILKENSDSFMIFIGVDSSYKDKCINLAKKLKVYEYMLFLNPTDDIYPYYFLSDVVMVPSLSEGFGLVAIEAQMCGTHVIASLGVPKETDLDLGLIDYVNLNDADTWSHQLSQARCKNPISGELVNNKFAEKGLSSKTGFQIIELIYQ